MLLYVAASGRRTRLQCVCHSDTRDMSILFLPCNFIEFLVIFFQLFHFECADCILEHTAYDFHRQRHLKILRLQSYVYIIYRSVWQPYRSQPYDPCVCGEKDSNLLIDLRELNIDAHRPCLNQYNRLAIYS